MTAVTDFLGLDKVKLVLATVFAVLFIALIVGVLYLRSEVKDLNKDLTKKEIKISDLNTQVNEKEASILGLQGDIKKLNDITESQKVDLAKNKEEFDKKMNEVNNKYTSDIAKLKLNAERLRNDKNTTCPQILNYMFGGINEDFGISK